MSVDDLTDDMVRQLADELRARYDLDEEGLRVLGARLAQTRREENAAFAERFTSEHSATFDRLAQ